MQSINDQQGCINANSGRQDWAVSTVSPAHSLGLGTVHNLINLSLSKPLIKFQYSRQKNYWLAIDKCSWLRIGSGMNNVLHELSEKLSYFLRAVSWLIMLAHAHWYCHVHIPNTFALRVVASSTSHGRKLLGKSTNPPQRAHLTKWGGFLIDQIVELHTQFTTINESFFRSKRGEH